MHHHFGRICRTISEPSQEAITGNLERFLASLAAPRSFRNLYSALAAVQYSAQIWRLQSQTITFLIAGDPLQQRYYAAGFGRIWEPRPGVPPYDGGRDLLRQMLTTCPGVVLGGWQQDHLPTWDKVAHQRTMTMQMSQLPEGDA